MSARETFICDTGHSIVKSDLVLHFDPKKIDELGLEGMPHTQLKTFGLHCSVRRVTTPTIFDLKTGQWIPDVTKPKVCSVRYE